MNKTETQKALDGNIPAGVIRSRQQGGADLAYLETWYVIDRLNQVLGQGNWGYQTQNLTKVFEGEVNGKHATSYTSTVALFATIEGRTVVFTEVGYGDGYDKNNPGKAHELAVKEAVSDGLKRGAKNLGRSMGLALYDKEQKYVGEHKVDEQKAATKTVPTEEKPAGTISARVTAAFKILEAQKKITKEEFKEKYQGGLGISKLTPDQLSGILDKVKKDFPQLSV